MLGGGVQIKNDLLLLAAHDSLFRTWLQQVLSVINEYRCERGWKKEKVRL